MMETDDIVFLFDVDNTLLDNDTIEQDIRTHFAAYLSPSSPDRYFEIFEQLRAELGYVDYLGAVQRYRIETPKDPRVLGIANWLLDYPFSQRFYPGAIEAVKQAGKCGRPVILSDGDAVFQPHKIQRSGLWNLFESRVLIYVHKEEMLEEVEKHYPARHYVMVDDKLRILSAIKKIWGKRVTTVFVMQGRYGRDSELWDTQPPADIQLEHIGNLPGCNRAAFLRG
jgi:FMN phosphatase YigB (HAD superfamily)